MGRWVDGSLYLRFAAAWEIVERWMAENLPDVHGTFQPALSLEDWSSLRLADSEKQLNTCIATVV